MEVIRPDEEPASKAGVPIFRDCGFESLGFRLEERKRALGRSAEASAFQAGQAGSIRAREQGPTPSDSEDEVGPR